MADELSNLMKKNLREGLIARAEDPDAARQQAEKMFPPEGPPEFVRVATPQEMRDAFRRAIHELFPTPVLREEQEECTPEIERSYQMMLIAAQEGAGALHRTFEAISPDTPDWIQSAWNLISARQKGRPHFTYKDSETGGLVHWSPAEGLVRRILNAQIDRPDAPAR